MSRTHDELLALLTEDGEFATERLDRWAATTPDRVAVHYGEEDLSYTYAALRDATDSIAGNLAAHGVAKGDRVSVFTTNSLAATLMMFGIWKAGAVYAPINFSFSGRLLAYQLNDTDPKLLVVDSGLLPRVNAVAEDLHRLPTLVHYAPEPGAHDHVAQVESPDGRFTTLSWEWLTAPATRPAVTVAFYDPANIVYTSGTTGPAKGVVQPHGWIAQYTFALRRVVNADDVVYNDLPMYHVGGALANVVRAIWRGAEVAVWDRFSPSDFWGRVASRGVTSAILLDVMIPWLMNAPEREEDRNNSLNKVHMQPLPLLHHDFARRFGIDIVTAGFGQTESGAPLSVTIEEVAEGEGAPAVLYRGFSREQIRERALSGGSIVRAGTEVTRKGVMGVVSPFLEVDILDDHDRPCDIAEPGQLAFRPKLPGIILEEYLGKPEATVKAWRNLWFHTGDCAVRQSDGMIDFLDRMGDRIRVRGENLSSFQVEDMINQHPAVNMTAAFSIPSQEGDEDEVVAYVVAGEGKSVTTDEIAAYAAETMPKYMRPKHIRVVAEIPRTPTNKIEKYKLRQQIVGELRGPATDG